MDSQHPLRHTLTPQRRIATAVVPSPPNAADLLAAFGARKTATSTPRVNQRLYALRTQDAKSYTHSEASSPEMSPATSTFVSPESTQTSQQLDEDSMDELHSDTFDIIHGKPVKRTRTKVSLTDIAAHCSCVPSYVNESSANPLHSCTGQQRQPCDGEANRTKVPANLDFRRTRLEDEQDVKHEGGYGSQSGPARHRGPYQTEARRLFACSQQVLSAAAPRDQLYR